MPYKYKDQYPYEKPKYYEHTLNKTINVMLRPKYYPIVCVRKWMGSYISILDHIQVCVED